MATRILNMKKHKAWRFLLLGEHPTAACPCQVTTPGRAKASTVPAGAEQRVIPALCQGLCPPNPQRHGQSRSPGAAGAKEHPQPLPRRAEPDTAWARPGLQGVPSAPLLSKASGMQTPSSSAAARQGPGDCPRSHLRFHALLMQNVT